MTQRERAEFALTYARDLGKFPIDSSLNSLSPCGEGLRATAHEPQSFPGFPPPRRRYLACGQQLPGSSCRSVYLPTYTCSATVYTYRRDIRVAFSVETVNLYPFWASPAGDLQIRSSDASERLNTWHTHVTSLPPVENGQ